MKYPEWSRLLMLVFGIGSSILAYGQAPQEVIGPDTSIHRVRWMEAPTSVSRSFTKDTLSIGPSQPFFDDFSQGSIPDSNKWDLRATISPRYPIINIGDAVNPPSLGVLTFDGASPENRPYENDLIRGKADRLESHYIDLGIHDPDNDIVLSFFLQPQGVGHQPTYRDSFKVYFNALTAIGSDSTELVKVYAEAGAPVRAFRQVVIPVANPLFFHTEFYIVFESEGYLNGLLHTWNVDYVTLGMSRAPTDTLYQDASLTYLSQPPMAPYTAIPYQQYQPSQLMAPFQVKGAFLGSNSTSLSLTGSITDPVGNNLPAPYQQTVSSSLSGYGSFAAGFTAYQDMVSLNSPYSATFHHEMTITSPTDAHPENNVLIQEYRIDTLLAYDDGEADVGYGLNRAMGFGQKYEISSQDSMMAVWICFVPQIDYLSGGSMEGADFQLTVWHDAHPDSILFQQGIGMKVIYGDTANHFERYPLTQALSVSGTIWVGISQIDDVSIGVGFDRTYNNNAYVNWDSSGNWVQSRLNGTLMIRPEMRNILFNPGPFTALDDLSLEEEMTIFPNPLTGNLLHIQNPEGTEVREFSLTIWDGQGRQVYLSQQWQETGYLLPDNLAAGVYFVRYQGIKSKGLSFRGTQKLLIAR